MIWQKMVNHRKTCLWVTPLLIHSNGLNGLHYLTMVQAKGYTSTPVPLERAWNQRPKKEPGTGVPYPSVWIDTEL